MTYQASARPETLASSESGECVAVARVTGLVERRAACLAVVRFDKEYLDTAWASIPVTIVSPVGPEFGCINEVVVGIKYHEVWNRDNCKKRATFYSEYQKACALEPDDLLELHFSAKRLKARMESNDRLEMSLAGMASTSRRHSTKRGRVVSQAEHVLSWKTGGR